MRIGIAIVLIATFVMLLAFVITRNKQYLILMKRLFKYIAWFVCILVLLSLISRVIRF